MIPAVGTAALPRLTDFCQGIILSGGGDILPEKYGVSVRDRTLIREPSPERDDFEISLAKLAYERDIPTLAICRGIQVLDVALGGTLAPDITGHSQTASRNTPSHDVIVSNGSLLHRLTGKSVLGTNSFHHQAVGKPAPVLTISGKAPDGAIESIEAAEKRFMLGVQWHPEHMTDRPEQRAIFKGLICAASIS